MTPKFSLIRNTLILWHCLTLPGLIRLFKTSNRELKRLVKQGKNYTFEDRVKIIDIQRQIIKKIIPTLKNLLTKTRLK